MCLSETQFTMPCNFKVITLYGNISFENGIFQIFCNQMIIQSMGALLDTYSTLVTVGTPGAYIGCTRAILLVLLGGGPRFSVMMNVGAPSDWGAGFRCCSVAVLCRSGSSKFHRVSLINRVRYSSESHDVVVLHVRRSRCLILGRIRSSAVVYQTFSNKFLKDIELSSKF